MEIINPCNSKTKKQRTSYLERRVKERSQEVPSLIATSAVFQARPLPTLAGMFRPLIVTTGAKATHLGRHILANLTLFTRTQRRETLGERSQDLHDKFVGRDRPITPRGFTEEGLEPEGQFTALEELCDRSALATATR